MGRGRFFAGCLLGLCTAVAWPSLAEPASQATSVAYYVPNVERNAAVPPPSDVLGWQVGEWHVRHDQLARYFEVLAESSERVRLEEIGRTHEQRPLLHATITSERNYARLQEIKDRHRALIESPGQAADLEDLPVLVNLSYSVHGNEASGSNASLVVAYHLASAQDEATAKLLDEVVVIIDPCLNPDGLSRFAQWANMHRGQVLVADPQHREHREGWPNGRTNHYWFDLNRDWLPAQHPESQARLGAFHSWMPHVLADFHEMGTDSTYFFQPGVPERKNPMTPMRNVELTAAFAERHAAALDDIGSAYFSEEIFDDYYYGKGSTYPDIHGAVGILFEQASARGHLQESKSAPSRLLSFPAAIRNQVATSFSTLEAASELRAELLDYRRAFFVEAAEMASADLSRGWLIGEEQDAERTAQLARILLHHGVRVHALAAEQTIGGQLYRPGAAYVVPSDQPQYRFLKALFDPVREFPDTTFYDVSTWTLPFAFDVPSTTLTSLEGLAGDQIGGIGADPSPLAETDEGVVAWAFGWSSYDAPLILRQMQDAGVVVQVALRPFEGRVGTDATQSFARGTIVVPRGLQTIEAAALYAMLEEAADEGVEVSALRSGLTPSGLDLGSPRMPVLDRPAPAILIGRGVNTYEAGEIWHLLDRRFGVETTLLERSRLDRVDLSRYSHLILVDGRWHNLGEKQQKALKAWLRGGGVVVAIKGAANWAEELLPKDADGPAERANGAHRPGEPKPLERKSYADARNEQALDLIGGAIFEVDLDPTHPLAFGFPRERLPVFRNSATVLEAPDDPYVTVAAYTAAPLLSGYASEENVERIAKTPAVVARRLGRGTLIQISDPPSFRAFWYGTDRLLLNALFFGGVVENTSGDGVRFTH